MGQRRRWWRSGGEAGGGGQAAFRKLRADVCYVQRRVRAMAAATVTRFAWSDGGGFVPRIPVSGLVPRR